MSKDNINKNELRRLNMIISQYARFYYIGIQEGSETEPLRFWNGLKYQPST